MTGQPDIAAALAWSGQVIRDAGYVQAALRGEPTPALSITSTPALADAEADRADPYGSSKHGRFDAASPAEVAEGVKVYRPHVAPCQQPEAHGLFTAQCDVAGHHAAEGAEPDDQSPACDCGWQGDRYRDVTR